MFFAKCYVYRDTMAHRKKTTTDFENALSRFREVAMNKINEKSEEINRLTNIVNEYIGFVLILF